MLKHGDVLRPVAAIPPFTWPGNIVKITITSLVYCIHVHGAYLTDHSRCPAAYHTDHSYGALHMTYDGEGTCACLQDGLL
jgi:hypothetical protein